MLKPAVATVAAVGNAAAAASVFVPTASTRPPMDTTAIDVRKNLNALDENDLIKEIALVQNALCNVEHCGPDAQAPQVAALPVLNLPSHASETGELQRKILIR